MLVQLWNALMALTVIAREGRELCAMGLPDDRNPPATGNAKTGMRKLHGTLSYTVLSRKTRRLSCFYRGAVSLLAMSSIPVLGGKGILC